MSKIFHFGDIILLLLVLSSGLFAQQALPSSAPRVDIVKEGLFPITTQLGPVPAGPGWQAGQAEPLSEQTLRDTIDNIIAHGFTCLQYGDFHGSPSKNEKTILDYAQSRGMVISSHLSPLELFGRTEPPKICVYSDEYEAAVRNKAEKQLAKVKDISRLYNVFTYQDEPFHWGPKSFGYNPPVKAEFKNRYGYDLPDDLESIKNDPKKWLDVINFRSDYFSDGWKKVYHIIKQIDPSFNVTLTHDSHNIFGSGVNSHCELAIDDVFHWGGNFADLFIYDIYPYMTFDYRYGEMGRFPQPRISQAHYSFAQMRNLTQAYGKQLGFWVGTYNPRWYSQYMNPDLAAKYWSERQMSATAVAQGCNYLITGYGIPIDAKHWESLGEGLRLIQKAGGKLLNAPKVKAKACMLFPRTQLIQLQEEYWNVGVSYELFLRAFGELDIIHEEQIKDDSLNGYQILVLFDVKLLPQSVAQNIAAFVRKGGVVIADCLPQMDEYKEPLDTLKDIFGVSAAGTDRIVRTGQWVPKVKPHWMSDAYRPTPPPDESPINAALLNGLALGQELYLAAVSPRPCEVTTGEVVISTDKKNPALVRKIVEKGKAYLLGFCLQDTYFNTYLENKPIARSQLQGLMRAITQDAGIQAHVYSSNPEIEAAIRANQNEGFLFIINHETTDADTTVLLGDLDFRIGKIIDLADGKPVEFKLRGGQAELMISAPLGETRLFHLLPAPAAEETALDMDKLPKNLKVALESTQPLKYPMGNRLPMGMWPVIVSSLDKLDDAQAQAVIKQLHDRGIGVFANWDYTKKEKSLAQSLRLGALQQKLGIKVNVNANKCMNSFFNGDESTFHIDDQGNKFFDDSFDKNHKMGCPFALKDRYPAIKEQIEYFLRGYKAQGLNIDLIFVDWEIDGPIEWNNAWANSKKCRCCRENIKDIDNFTEFQNALRTIRCDMQRAVLADNVKAYFPSALIGNYGVYPTGPYRYWYDYFEKPITEGIPYLADQRAKYRSWFQPEFDLTGYTFAMPVSYTWYWGFDWYDFDNPDYRWFYNMLLVASNACAHTPADIPIINWVHWNTTVPPENPDPAVKQFSQEKYQELLWHMLLRGTDTFYMWCPAEELAVEARLMQEVFADSLQYRDFLDTGRPITFDVPSRQGPVISGLQLGNKVLLRRTDFDDSRAVVTIKIDDKELPVPRLDGKCQIFELD